MFFCFLGGFSYKQVNDVLLCFMVLDRWGFRIEIKKEWEHEKTKKDGRILRRKTLQICRLQWWPQCWMAPKKHTNNDNNGDSRFAINTLATLQLCTLVFWCSQKAFVHSLLVKTHVVLVHMHIERLRNLKHASFWDKYVWFTHSNLSYL